MLRILVTPATLTSGQWSSVSSWCYQFNMAFGNCSGNINDMGSQLDVQQALRSFKISISILLKETQLVNMCTSTEVELGI